MKRHEEIARKAYELFEKSGRVHGRDAENWLEAEKTVLAKVKPVKKASGAKKASVAAPRKKSTARSGKRA